MPLVEDHMEPEFVDMDALSQRRTLLPELSDSSVMAGVMGLAAVAVVNRSPRLALRAARVVLETEYASRSSVSRRRWRTPSAPARRQG
jgi:hypothetical protein